MDVQEKAYDYIDYTLSELSKMEETCVSLMYFFKVFSPAGELAQKILLDHDFIEVQNEDNSHAVVCITDKGREALRMGGVREYLDYLDGQARTKKKRIRKMRNLIAWAACVAGAVVITGFAVRAARNA